MHKSMLENLSVRLSDEIDPATRALFLATYNLVYPNGTTIDCAGEKHEDQSVFTWTEARYAEKMLRSHLKYKMIHQRAYVQR